MTCYHESFFHPQESHMNKIKCITIYAFYSINYTKSLDHHDRNSNNEKYFFIILI